MVGSSTACIATVNNRQNLLVVANIGDSGVFVLRRHNLELAGTLGNLTLTLALALTLTLTLIGP